MNCKREGQVRSAPVRSTRIFPSHYRQIRTGLYITRISLFSFSQQHFKKELNNLERVKNEYMRKNSEQVKDLVL